MRGEKKKKKTKRDGKRKVRRIKGMVRKGEEKRKRCHEGSSLATYIHMVRLDLINKYSLFQLRVSK